MVPLVGATFAPGRTRCMPLITMRSSRRHAGAHDAQPPLEVAGFDDAPLRHVVLAQDPHESLRLIAQNRAVGHQQRIELAGAEQQQATELAGREEAARVGHDGARADRAGGRDRPGCRRSPSGRRARRSAHRAAGCGPDWRCHGRSAARRWRSCGCISGSPTRSHRTRTRSDRRRRSSSTPSRPPGRPRPGCRR